MKIVYTKHALNKFIVFQKKGVKLTKQKVNETIKAPEDIDIESDKPKIIVSKLLDKGHIIRVVYIKESDINNQNNHLLSSREGKILLK